MGLGGRRNSPSCEQTAGLESINDAVWVVDSVPAQSGQREESDRYASGMRPKPHRNDRELLLLDTDPQRGNDRVKRSPERPSTQLADMRKMQA